MTSTLALSRPERRRRVVALGLAVAAYLLAFFHRVAPAAIAPDLAKAFQTSAAGLGVLAATYFYIYTLMQVPTGVLADTLGARRILTLGGLIAGAGSILFGLAPSFEIAVIGRTLVGLGVSVGFIASLKLVAVWYEESRFASLVGLIMFIGNIGPVVAGAPLAWAADAWSWRGVFIAVAGMSFVIAALSWVFVSDGPQGAGRARMGNRSWIKGLVTVLMNRDTWPGFVANLGLGGSFLSFAGLWAVPYLMQAHGISRAAASNHVSVYFLCFAVGCLFIGGLSDRLGRRRPLMASGALIYVAFWLIWLPGTPLGYGLSYLLFGVMGLVTSCFTLSWACAKEVNPPLLSGMATSVVNVGVFLGAAVLQPLVGWLMDRSWSGAMASGVRVYSAGDYRNGLALMMGFAAVGFAATLFVRETRCRNVWQPD